MEKTKEKISTKLEKNWEIKDRYYYVLGSHQPLTMRIPSQHSRKYPLLWFDEDSGKQRELRYATNMNSCFKDEQEGEATMGHIMFKDGSLTVPKRYQALQKLLSLYQSLDENCDFRSGDLAKLDEHFNVCINFCHPASSEPDSPRMTVSDARANREELFAKKVYTPSTQHCLLISLPWSSARGSGADD